MEFTDIDITKVSSTYHNWRTNDFEYKDVQGFCKSITIEEVKVLNYAITPGRFVGFADDEEEFIFEERFNNLKTELEKQIAEEDVLNKRIAECLSKVNIKVESNG